MVRIMIVLLLGASAWLGWNYTKQEAALERYERELSPGGAIERSVTKTHEAAFAYERDLKAVVKDGLNLSDKDSTELKILKVLQNENVQWGGVDIMSSSKLANGKTVENTVYKIIHKDRNKKTIRRSVFANLGYILQTEHPNLPITKIDLEVSGKSAPHEIPADNWTCSFDVTERKTLKKTGRN